MAKILKANAERLVIYTGTDDAPFDDPLAHAASARTKFSSTFEYMPIIPARTIDATIAIPSQRNARSRIITIGPHGQAGIPFIYGYVFIGGRAVPFCGSIPVYVTPSDNFIVWTLGVNATSVFIAELRTSAVDFGGPPARTVKVHVSSKIVE